MGMYLKIALRRFGTLTKDGDIKTFYHGLSEKLLFPDYFFGVEFEGISIKSPISTTSSPEVASNFTAGNNGLILALQSISFEFNRYFSVSWLSDFPYEKEYLFIQNEGHFQIQNIFDVTTGYEYANVLDCI